MTSGILLNSHLSHLSHLSFFRIYFSTLKFLFSLFFCVASLFLYENKNFSHFLACSAGDVLLGLPSSGVHSNGFSLVRRVVAASGLAYDAASPFAEGKQLGESLLTPTRLYVKDVLGAAQSGNIKAMAHITGGGISGNLPRVLPPNLGAVMDAKKWDMLPVFQWMRAVGNIAEAEMLKTFNLGLGMILVVAKEHADSVLKVRGRGLEMCGSP